MYQNTAAEIRPDLGAVVEQALAADSYFIGETLLPTKFSGRRTGDYHRIPLAAGELLASASLGNSTRRAPRTAYKQVDRTYEKDGFTTVDRGLTEVVDDGDAAEVLPSFNAEALATKLTLRDVRIAQEARVKDTLFNTTTFTADNSAVAYTEANIATIDFAQDIENAIAKVQKRGEMVNAVVLNRNVWKRIRRSTLLRKYIFGENGGNSMITRDMLAKAFAESAAITFYIAEASYATSKKGQAVTDSNLSYIWPETYVWVGCIANPGSTPDARRSFRSAPVMANGDQGPLVLDQGVGATIVWEQQADSLYVVESYRDENVRSDKVRVRQHSVEHVFNANAGTLITTQYA